MTELHGVLLLLRIEHPTLGPPGFRKVVTPLI
jgi:hypothetical protein